MVWWNVKTMPQICFLNNKYAIYYTQLFKANCTKSANNLFLRNTIVHVLMLLATDNTLTYDHILKIQL